MSKKRIRLVVVFGSIVVFLAAIAVSQNVQEAYAIAVTGAVSSIMVAVTRTIFAKKAVPRSPYPYYVALALSTAAGILAGTMLTPFICLRPWGVKVLVSAIASVLIVVPTLLLARLMKVNILPWEQDK
jgi:uncharacterized membrane protein YoaK (UPF0700 family)